MEFILYLNLILFAVLVLLLIAALFYFKTIPIDKLKEASIKDEVLFTTSTSGNYKIGSKYNKHIITRIEKGHYYFLIYGKPA